VVFVPSYAEIAPRLRDRQLRAAALDRPRLLAEYVTAHARIPRLLQFEQHSAPRLLLVRASSRAHAACMKTLLALILLVAACGGSKPPTTEPTDRDHAVDDGKVVGPPTVAWKDMSQEQRAKYMKAVVVPKFKPMFQEFDAKTFANFGCATCHGPGVKDHKFDMPNPGIFVLPEAPDDFKKLGEKKPDWMKLMLKVEVEMANTLGMPPYDPAKPDPSQFGCYGCHTHKPGGGSD
jgi:hypothetical protein